MENESLKRLSEAVQTAARQTGSFIAQEALKFQATAVEYKETNNVVSFVDKEAEKQLVEALRNLLPEAGFITEEGTTPETSNRDGLNWIIDPLDGTANFVHGVPNYSISLALAQGKEVILGVVYHIPANKMFSAIKDGGAFCNGEPITVARSKTLNESLLATGFPYYKFDNMEKYLRILDSLMQKTHGLRRFGSAAIDLAYVACGYFDGFYEYNLNSWDMAAGILLVREAGGTVTDFAGKDNFLFGGDIVAANAVHGELLTEIRRFWVK